MNSREINKILSRIQFWKGELSEQWKLKKENRNQRTIEDAESRISILKGWLKGVVVAVPEGSTIEKKIAVAEAMPMEEFKKLANQALGATGEPGAVMVIHDRKMLDMVYDKIKLANIQISAPPSVLAYYREKLRKERPYKQ